MSKYLKTLNDEENKFREELPNLLKKATKENQGVSILSRRGMIGSTKMGTQRYEQRYNLGVGQILIYQRKDDPVAMILNFPYDGPVERLNYREFAESLSSEELIHVAKVLAKLGF